MANLSSYIPKKFLEDSKRIKQANFKLHQCIPPAFVHRCRVTQYSGNQVTIVTDGPESLHNLRFYSNSIKDTLKCSHLKIIIDHPEKSKKTFINKQLLKKDKALDQQSREHIERAKRSLKHPKLQEAFEKLSHLSKNKLS